MVYYNNNYIQKRSAEKNSKIVGKEIAEAAHFKEVRNAINLCANEIANKFGLSKSTAKNIASLISNDGEMSIEVYKRINFLLDLLEKYGYTKEKAISIIDSNFSLIQQSSISLIHNLSIASQHNFDENLLVNNRLYSNINEKELYALIEELKSNRVEITPENVLKLYILIKNDNKMADLVQLHPLEKRQVLIYRTLYERSISNNKTLSKTK